MEEPAYAADNLPPTEAAPELPTQLAGVVGQEAWSDPMAIPDYKPQRDWGKMTKALKYIAPAAAAIAAIFWVTLGGHRTNPTPTPAPPHPVVEAWTPDHSKDDAYIKALIDGGYEVAGINATSSDAPSREEDLEQAYWTCTTLSQGKSVDQVVKHWDDIQMPGVSAQDNHDDDVTWVNIMVKTLCPQFSGENS